MTELEAIEADRVRLLEENEKLRAEISSAESERDEARSDAARYESDSVDASSEIEDLEEQVSDLQSEIDSIHEGIGMRSIIERSWAADPIATENDLQSAGLGHACSVLRTDHKSGYLYFGKSS